MKFVGMVMFLLGFAVDCLAQVTWSYNLDDKNCDVFIQVNEGKNVLYLETMHIPGQYMTTSLWGTSATMCHINENDESYINGMKRNGAVTFLNNENQICFFENLGFSTGNMGGFYVQPWSYVYGVNIRVSCEDSSSIPLYCAKTEKMAQQVLLAREELECIEKGGNFEGGVYPFEMPDGGTEYCVAGRCDVCNSKWYKNFVDHWKDSVCCDIRGKEPNANNGTCISPSSFDSTKVGVKHSRITAFPGCSKASAGEGNHFCKGPESSSTGSSSSEGSSSSGNSSSSGESSSSEASSSSATPMSSSSEEQENADCYAGDAEANAALYNADVECWSMQKESGYSLDGNGCLVGGCVDANSSDSMEDGENSGESSSSEAESSSSEEDRCVDVSLKKVSGEEADPWVYVGKETYASRMVTYEKTTPNTGFFDALGRMYRQIKSRIKYYMGKETKVKKTVEIGEEFDVWKKNEFLDGENVVSYRKFNKDSTIEIDSSIYENGLYDVIEVNIQGNYYRHTDTSEIEFYVQYENKGRIKELFFVGLNYKQIYNKEGILKSQYKQVIDDTVFFDVEYLNHASILYENGFSLRRQESNFVLAKKVYSGLQIGLEEDPSMPKAQYMRFEKEDIGRKNNGLKTGKIFSPGINNDATFGYSDGKFNNNGFSCDYDCDEGGRKLYYHSQTFPLIGESITIMVSNWKKDKETNEWKELCWKKKDMQATYDHEAQHIRNARYELEFLFHHFMITSESLDNEKFTNERDCNARAKVLLEKVKGEYFKWKVREIGHDNVGTKIGEYYIPPSPKETPQGRTEGICPAR